MINNYIGEKDTLAFSEVANKMVWDFLLKPEDVAHEKIMFRELIMGKSTNDYQSYLITKKGDKRLISRISWDHPTLGEQHASLD